MEYEKKRACQEKKKVLMVIRPILERNREKEKEQESKRISECVRETVYGRFK